MTCSVLAEKTVISELDAGLIHSPPTYRESYSNSIVFSLEAFADRRKSAGRDMGTGGTSRLATRHQVKLSQTDYHQPIPVRLPSRLSQYARHVGTLMNVKQRYARNIITGAVLRVTPWGDSPLPLGRHAIPPPLDARLVHS
jgi:hypothetical protein